MTAKKRTKKRDARAKLLFCVAFSLFSMPSPSSLLNLPFSPQASSPSRVPSKISRARTCHSRVFSRVPLVGDFSRYPTNGELAAGNIYISSVLIPFSTEESVATSFSSTLLWFISSWIDLSSSSAIVLGSFPAGSKIKTRNMRLKWHFSYILTYF